MTSIPLSDLEGGGQAASFTAYGDKHGGRVVSVDKRPQTDPNTGQPKLFQSGDPMWLYVITVQPEHGDAVALWAKGGKYVPIDGEGASMLTAISTAVRASGANELSVGGELIVMHTGLGTTTGQAPKAGFNAAKLFKAQYRPPAPASVAVDDLFSE